MYSSSLIGTGSYLPPKILTNFDLEQSINTSDEWIFSRTGIKQRHIAEHETTSDMGTKAAKIALDKAQISANELDLIIVATTTPDLTFPASAALIQNKLGITEEIPFFDVQAVCTGFIYALTLADNFIKLGQARNVLVIGADRMSQILDWQDRKSCILFGDGAGAVILQQKNLDSPQKIIATELSGNGNCHDILKTSGGPGSNAITGFVEMDGKEVYKLAVEKLSKTITSLLASNHISIDDVDILIPHQANVRILTAVGERISFPKEKIVITLDQHANTSAASIPLALDHYMRQKQDNIPKLGILAGIGGGMTWGSVILRF